jgi:hypothetical protein
MYKTPGVYVEEISTLPPSVAEVSTAIPAFIGHTEKGTEVKRIKTLLEYEAEFGGPKPTAFTVEAHTDSQTKLDVVDSVAPGNIVNGEPEFLLYYCVSHYFKNGGGPCYIIPAGDYDAAPSKAEYVKALDSLEKEDEPTLILLTDAIKLPVADYYELCDKALAQCKKLRDRFVIMDVREGDVAGFRDTIGMNALMYGAAYHPYLKTTLNFHAGDEDVQIKSDGTDAALGTIKEAKTSLYNQVKVRLQQQRVVLPPSAAIAGIYARVDRDRGVWKAPANVSVAAVIGPVSKTTDADQAELNVDPTAGKSINVVRAFTGKGTLVWGARTLAGNDNEWRYVPVRRLFIMIEESVQKSTAFAVFEPNDATTWLKVKGMIESYLYGLWERGALAGPTPESAYFVNVGLGRTMTAQDILEGRMNVEIGVAAVRPAEFIILRFSHKMQEA